MKRTMLACGLVLAMAAAMASGQSKPAGTAGGAGSAPGLVSLAVQLEQGIYQEETAGQLEAAAKTYGQIAAQAEATRLLAAQALYRLAVVQGKLKQTKEAEETVGRLLAEYPEQRDLIAKAMVAVPGFSGLRTPNAGGPGPTAAPTAEQKAKAVELVTKGWQYMGDQRYPDAADTFARAAKLDPTSPAALTGQGWAGLYGKDPVLPEIKDRFLAALEIDPHYAAALSGAGRYFYGVGENARAEEYWKAAIEADPKATGPMASLASEAAYDGRYDDATGWYEKLLKIEPQNASAKSRLNEIRLTQSAIKDGKAVVDGFLKQFDAGKYRDAAAPLVPLNTLPRLMNFAEAAAVEEGVDLKEWENNIRAQRESWGKLRTRTVQQTVLFLVNERPTGMRGGFETPGAGGMPIGGGMGGGTGRSGGGRASVGGPVSVATRFLTVPAQATSISRVTIGYVSEYEHQKVSEGVTITKNDSGQWRVTQYVAEEVVRGIDPLKAR